MILKAVWTRAHSAQDEVRRTGGDTSRAARGVAVAGGTPWHA